MLVKRSPDPVWGKKKSLVHTVPVYAPVRPDSLQPADRGEPGRIRKETWVRSYIPGSATDQTRCRANIAHGLSR